MHASHAFDRHIKEHYEGQLNFNETDMTPEELEFHYFKLVKMTSSM